MQKSEDAVTHMQQKFEGVTYLVGNQDILEHIEEVPALPIFSEKVLDFLSCLSKVLLHNLSAKKYGDIIAFAFWIRRVSLERYREEYKDEVQRIGRGVAFQIAPSNIPVQFAVSMTYALAAGNASVVRVSNKNFEQVEIICNAINSIITEQCPGMSSYICVLRYNHDDAISKWLSNMCDIRMIWGGDSTIATIRKIPTRPRCVDIGFADRYSLAIIDSDDYLIRDKTVLATDFYNDTYYTDQNACSSVRLIVWTGGKIEDAKKIFWEALEREVLEKYELNPISGSEKLLNTAVCAARYPGIKEIRRNNMIVRAELPELYDDILDYKGNSGYFFEYSADNLEYIIPLLKNECQTITFVGHLEEKLRKIISDFGVRGVDRIVPMGHSMDLSFTWDGYDLPIALSRHISNI